MVDTPRLRLRPPAPLDARIRPPGSKSLSNRALLLAAAAEGDSILRGLLQADDTDVMCACLRALGTDIELAGDVAGVRGRGDELGRRAAAEPLQLGTAGTVARFLPAVLAATRLPDRAPLPRHRFDGSDRMRERPMAQLLDALAAQGATITWEGRPGALPFTLQPAASGWRGGEIALDRPASSQFVSALVLAAARGARPTRIVLREGTPARPYIDMTLALLRAFGGRAEWSHAATLDVEPARLRGCEHAIEPDASAASYLLALAAIHGGSVTVTGLGRTSLQGDAGFFRVLERMGAQGEQTDGWTRVRHGPLVGARLDLSDMPDTAPTAAVVALFADGATTITGVEVLRHHESDRLAAAATELRKLGATVEERPDGLRIEPPADGPRRGVSVRTYDDHRMAMALSLVGDVVVEDPACVAKTYPGFFDELSRLGMVDGG
jgi:3-phosphoshikimate 1-carboxyvinyltransferase